MSFPISFSITIDGTQKHPLAGSLEIRQVQNGRATAYFELLSEDRSYRPAIDDPIIITENAVTIFGGLNDRAQERGFSNPPRTPIVTPINAVDFNALIERRIALTTIPTGTMKAAFEQLRSEYLDEYGTTLHGSQVDGPTLPFIEYGGWKLTDAFDDLLIRTANAGSPAEMFTYWIDFNNVLRVFQPSTNPAPFDLIGDDLDDVVGDVEVEETLDSTYANKVIGRIPATATSLDIYVYAENFTESALRGHRDAYFVFHDQPTEAVAQERVNNELAWRSIPRRVARYRTFRGGLQPGMSQVIDIPARNVDTVGVISEIVTRDFGWDRLVREVTVTVDSSSTNLGRTFGDVYRLWAKDKEGSDQGQVASTAATPGPPDESVQTNQGNVFSGKSTFIFKYENNSVVMGGGGSSITATAFESCGVFGYNCHITD